jgi:outer membrane protein assembly factor BamB
VGSCSGEFRRLDRASGEPIWSFDAAEGKDGAQFHGDVLLLEDLVIVGTDGDERGALWAFARDSGALRWKLPAGSGVACGLPARDGLVWAGTLEDELLCLRAATGERVWSFDGDSGEAARTGLLTPALAGETLVWAGAGLDVFALHAATGDVRWTRRLTAPARTNALVHDGDVFVGTEDGGVHRLALESGDTVSMHFVPATPRGDLVPAGGALLLFTGWMQPFGELLALDPETGDVRWSVAPPDTSTWTAKRPFVHGDRAFIGNSRGEVFAVDVASGEATPLWRLGSTVRSFAFADGLILVGTLDGSLRAFRDE